MKIKLRYIGNHQAKRIFEVDEKRAEEYVKSGECEYVDINKSDRAPEKPKVFESTKYKKTSRLE